METLRLIAYKRPRRVLAFCTVVSGLIVCGYYIWCTTSSAPASSTYRKEILTPSTFAESSRETENTFLNVDPDAIEVDNAVASDLETKVRVLIWVMTSPENLARARAVKDTWGKRCSQLLFFSSKANAELPALGLDVPEGRQHLTAKTVKAFDYIIRHHFHQADWFMKADDDTYIIMENLRHFLSDKVASDPLVTGRHMVEPTLNNQSFMSGGAGYILSKEALRRFGTRQGTCAEDGGQEDVNMGRCLEGLGVRFLNSSDVRGRSRFHPYPPESHVVVGMYDGYEKYDANIVRIGASAVSDFAISFHYIKPEQMRILDFYMYHLRPYGISHKYK